MATTEKQRAKMREYYQKNRERLRAYGREYHYKNREKKRQRDKEIRKEWESVLPTECSVCGYNKCFAAIEYHHVEEKDFEIGTFIRRKLTDANRDKVMRELEKCVTLCANCHRELHAKETA